MHGYATISPIQTMKKTQIPGRTKKQRAAYFIGGRATTGTIGQFDEQKREFYTSYVGKVRGRIISGRNGEWKFETEQEAQEAADWFLQNCKDYVGQRNTPAEARKQ